MNHNEYRRIETTEKKGGVNREGGMGKSIAIGVLSSIAVLIAVKLISKYGGVKL